MLGKQSEAVCNSISEEGHLKLHLTFLFKTLTLIIRAENVCCKSKIIFSTVSTAVCYEREQVESQALRLAPGMAEMKVKAIGGGAWKLSYPFPLTNLVAE